MASVAYVVSPPLATARSKDATFQIVKILVLGVTAGEAELRIGESRHGSALRLFRRHLPLALQSLHVPRCGLVQQFLKGASVVQTALNFRHPSYVLYGRRKGRRFSVYIPEELVPRRMGL
jgi:hypothetical protein